MIYLRAKDLVDVALRGIIHKLLLSFVRICELSVKVLHGNKTLKFLKVLAFNGDDGIKGELEKLKSLVEKESQMKQALTLESVKTSERNIVNGFSATKEGVRAVLDKVNDSDKKREANRIEKKQRETIQQALNQKDMYKKPHEDLKKTIVENTGKWLQQDNSFIRWADWQKDSESILCISGKEGYGKSYLVYTAIQALKKRYILGQENHSRTSVAYYYFRKGEQSLEDCLKALAWQIVLTDPVYQKDLADSCKDLDDADVEELWNRLFANHSAADATLFILLDGVNSIDKKYTKDWWKLLKNVQGRPSNKGPLRIRLLLSARVDTLEEIRRNLENPVLNIDLSSKNRDDIQIFIKDRLNKMNILSDLSKEQSLRDEISTSLAEDADGDFVNIDLLLKEISGMQRPSEIRAVLTKAKASDGRSDTIEREIQRCNKLLKDRDIQDLNELLAWVICAEGVLTLGELEAALYLKHRESSLGLGNRIQDQYSAFFHISGVGGDPDDATVTLVSDSIKEYFQKPPKTTGIEHLEADANLHESEVKIIKKFLETICDAELFAKFGFEEFFKRKLNRNATFIAVDLENAHLKILTGCLELISGDDCVETQPLFEYAVSYFPEHLKNVNLPLADPIKKAEIGKKLFELFSKNQYIEKWWTVESWLLRYLWIYQDSYVEAVLDWFKDPAAINQLSDTDKEWTKSLTANSSPGLDLLDPIMKFLASKRLRGFDCGSSEGVTMGFFACVHGYINKVCILLHLGKQLLKVAEIDQKTQGSASCSTFRRSSDGRSRVIRH